MPKTIQAHIITIGDEILVGQTVDTNSTFIAQQLNSIGISISEIQSIKDDEKHIVDSLNIAMSKNDIVIITGGLGPTNDDITKRVLVNYFDDELVIYPEILDRIQEFFVKFNKPFLKVNWFQAMLPKNAFIIENDLGTASGMWFNKGGKIVVSMPGVPYEMKALMLKVVEKIKTTFALGDFYHKTILLQGIGESYLADDLIDWENDMRRKEISVSYLPSIGQLKLRLTGKGIQKKYIDDGLSFIEKKYPGNVFGFNSQTLEQVLGDLLISKNKSVGTVESCTAGSLASRIVSVPGSSNYYNGSIVSYSNKMKTDFVGVNPDFIKNFGAVSQQVVEDMAKKGRVLLKSDYCVSTSGIAGPDGGTSEKPVGTVWISVASIDDVWSKKFNFGHTRQNNIESTVNYALNFLRRVMLKMEI